MDSRKNNCMILTKSAKIYEKKNTQLLQKRRDSKHKLQMMQKIFATKTFMFNFKEK